MENIAGEHGLAPNNFFHTNLLNFIKIQTVIKSHPLMPGSLKLGHLLV